MGQQHERPGEAGQFGEDFVEWACRSPFGNDFLFRGQKYRDGQNEIELCDLLLFLDDTAVLMEVKTADREKRPSRTEQEWANWANARLRKALAQIQRGAAALRADLVKEIENERQGRVSIDPSKLKHFYGLAIVDHPTLEKMGRGPMVDAAGVPVSVMTTTHSELMDLLTELSTPGDLIDYLQAREVFFSKHAMMGITELDLLAVYKGDPDDFRKRAAEKDVICIEPGCWAEFSMLEMRKQRDQMNRPSLIIDAILDRLHGARHARLPHIEAARAQLRPGLIPTEAYAAIATELAKIRRIDRRDIGERLIEKSRKCVEQTRDRWFAVTPMTGERATFVFVVSLSSRQKRLQRLEIVTTAAALKYSTEYVIGIATEPVTADLGASIDAFMIAGDLSEMKTRIPPDMLAKLLAQFGQIRHPNVTEFGGPASDGQGPVVTP